MASLNAHRGRFSAAETDSWFAERSAVALVLDPRVEDKRRALEAMLGCGLSARDDVDVERAAAGAQVGRSDELDAGLAVGFRAHQ